MKKKALPENQKGIRLSVLQELKDMLESNPMPIEKKKVTVMAKDEKGLEEGLAKAKEMLAATEDDEMEDEAPESDEDGKLATLKAMLKAKKS